MPIEASLKGQTAIITGAGRGIGAACVRALTREGARVLGVSRTKADLVALKKVVPSFEYCVADVSVEKSVKDLFEFAKSILGRLDILINNAGIIDTRPVAEMSLEVWNTQLAVNLTAAFLCSREALKWMDSGPGSIVNVASLAGIQGSEKFPGTAAYVASKMGLVGLTECLAVEGRGSKKREGSRLSGVRVNCVAPGAVNTAMLRKAAPGLVAGAEPEDVAEAVLFFCDPARSGVITGSVMEMNTNQV